MGQARVEAAAVDQRVSRGAVLLVAIVSSFVTPVMMSSVNIAIPSIGSEFGLDAVILSWLATSYSLAAAMFLVPFGRIADIYGRREILLWGVAVYTVSVLLCGFANSAAALIAFRLLQGVGAAMQFGTAMAILTAVFPQSERGRVLGVNVASVYTGLAVGPFVGGVLTESFGWRSIFFLGVALGLVMIVAILQGLKAEWADARGERLDTVGSVVYCVSLAAFMYGLSFLPGTIGVGLIVLGILGLVGFILWEAREKHPVLNVRLFQHNAVFSFSNLAALLNYSATSASGFLLSLYLQYLKGMTPQQAGMVMIAQPIVMAVFSPFAGRLSDRIEPRVVSSAGMVLTVVGLGLFTALDASTDISYIVVALLVSGLGFALFSSPNTNAVMSSVEKRYYGIASATLGTMRLIGQVLSMGIAMVVFALVIGAVQITPEVYSSFLTAARTLFALFAAMSFVGIFASLARGKVR